MLTLYICRYCQKIAFKPKATLNAICRLQTNANQPSNERKQTMNSSIETSRNYAYHTFANVEFTGFVDIWHLNNNYDYDYHLFIRYGNKIYMDVKGVGEVVITYEELQKNKYWKYYYDLSLMLADDKQIVAQELRFSSDYCDYILYDTARHWWIDTNYIVNNELHRYGDKGIRDTYDKLAYFKINPYDLENMDYTSQEDLEVFRMNYMSLIEVFETKCDVYNNLAIEYQTKKMDEMNEEIEELSTYFKFEVEDRKNVLSVIALYEKNEDMNRDLLMIIYKNLVRTNANHFHLVASIGY
jgi:hypothetical protein